MIPHPGLFKKGSWEPKPGLPSTLLTELSLQPLSTLFTSSPLSFRLSPGPAQDCSLLQPKSMQHPALIIASPIIYFKEVESIASRSRRNFLGVWATARSRQFGWPLPGLGKAPLHYQFPSSHPLCVPGLSWMCLGWGEEAPRHLVTMPPTCKRWGSPFSPFSASQASEGSRSIVAGAQHP